jgi:S-adenosylmethionine-dependent methyltransferase
MNLEERLARLIDGRSTPPSTQRDLLWEDVRESLPFLAADADGASPPQPLTVLAVGSESGLPAQTEPLARRLVEAGHDVTLLDAADDEEGAAGADAPSSLRPITVCLRRRRGTIEAMEWLFDPASFDLVLCHDALEWTPSLAPVVAALARVTRPGGHVSLLFYNRRSIPLTRAVAGHFADAREWLERREQYSTARERSHYPRTLEEVGIVVETGGFEVVSEGGLQIVSDLLPDEYRSPEYQAELHALENELRRRPPYVEIARYVHVVGRRS